MKKLVVSLVLLGVVAGVMAVGVFGGTDLVSGLWHGVLQARPGIWPDSITTLL